MRFQRFAVVALLATLGCASEQAAGASPAALDQGRADEGLHDTAQAAGGRTTLLRELAILAQGSDPARPTVRFGPDGVVRTIDLSNVPIPTGSELAGLPAAQFLDRWVDLFDGDDGGASLVQRAGRSPNRLEFEQVDAAGDVIAGALLTVFVDASGVRRVTGQIARGRDTITPGPSQANRAEIVRVAATQLGLPLCQRSCRLS